MRSVRIGAAQGFYGDSIEGTLMNIEQGNLDYLAFDALAELTMAILSKDKMRDSELGYTRDIYSVMKTILPLIKEKGVKVLTNAGGLNPLGAQKLVLKIAKDLGFDELKVAVVTGDDIQSKLMNMSEDGVDLDDLETGRRFTKKIHDKLLFANAYLGAEPLVEALHLGADIVISGRTTDTAQFLAPLVYEFNWKKDEWDKLASGVFLGHLLECSAQSTGGNFSAGWQEVKDFNNIGYPIAEIDESGDFIITKVEGSGGLVNEQTVKEQMLYEIHDPAAYLTPDVVMDITNVKLDEVAPNVVKVTGVRGKKRPDSLKVVMGYEDGFMGQAIVGYSWPDALLKARKAKEIILKKIKEKDFQYDKIHVDFMGHNSLHGPLSAETEDLNEVYLRVAVKAGKKHEAEGITRLFPPLALNGPPTMVFLGNFKTRQQLGMWSFIVPRKIVENNVKVNVVKVGDFK